MKYAIVNPRNGIQRILSQPPLRPHIELTDEQAEKASAFKEQNRLAFLIDGEITNFREQHDLGNSMRWDDEAEVWVLTPLLNHPKLDPEP